MRSISFACGFLTFATFLFGQDDKKSGEERSRTASRQADSKSSKTVQNSKLVLPAEISQIQLGTRRLESYGTDLVVYFKKRSAQLKSQSERVAALLTSNPQNADALKEKAEIAKQQQELAKEELDARESYRAAFLQYGEWTTYLKAAALIGQTRNLPSDTTYKEKSEKATELCDRFAKLSLDQLGKPLVRDPATGSVVFLKLVDLGVSLWQRLSKAKLDARKQEVEILFPLIQLKEWSQLSEAR
jgi:hypothetical protein